MVTGSRAEYGLLEPVLHKIEASHALELQLIVTGAHLLPEFGSTVEDIRQAGFKIDRLISEITSAASGADVSRQIGAGTIAFTDALEALAPDAVLLVGDRYELLAPTLASFFLNIPIVHVHGGEITNGAFDDAIRHAISKFSQLHAVAAPEYAARLIRAGENPDSVAVVGGLGVDAVGNYEKLTREQLEAQLGIPLGHRLLLVTYHPVTADEHDTMAEIRSIVAALSSFPEMTVIFTLPNADPENKLISEVLTGATSENKKWHMFSSLGTQKYLSLLSYASAVIGNSSSGLLEAPALRVPTVNIGPRQSGRIQAPSVLSCGTSRREIESAISIVLTSDFLSSFEGMETPYGGVGASDKIISLLESTAFGSLGYKKYWDEPESD